MVKKPIEWTEKHEREGFARTFELSADRIRATFAPLAAMSFANVTCSSLAGTERRYRATMAAFGFDAARIDREVRRVDALATGRLVREAPVLHLRNKLGTTIATYDAEDIADARAMTKKYDGRHVVRVTRIRRASHGR